MADTSVPVVLVQDRPAHGAVAVARTLGRLGVEVHLISDRRASPGSTSRFWKRRAFWDLEASNDESLRVFTDFAARIGGKPILLAMTDGGALFIEQNAAALKAAYVFPDAAPKAIRTLTDKWQMYLAAKRLGIPAPEAAFPITRDEALRFCETAAFPVIMKGADQRRAHAKTKEIVKDRHALLEAFDRTSADGPANLILQEYIPGDAESVWMCNAYFGAECACRAIFTGRKLRQDPPDTGIASLAICLPNDVVADQTKRFMQSVGYQGLVGVGWRYDARDGRYKVLDVNPRVSGIFRLFRATNGLDVVRVGYLDLTGQPVPQTALEPGRKWLIEQDVFSSLAYARSGRLTFAQWLRSLRGVRELHWFAADDPVPFLAWLWSVLRSFIAHRLTRLRSNAAPR